MTALLIRMVTAACVLFFFTSDLYGLNTEKIENVIFKVLHSFLQKE